VKDGSGNFPSTLKRNNSTWEYYTLTIKMKIKNTKYELWSFGKIQTRSANIKYELATFRVKTIINKLWSPLSNYKQWTNGCQVCFLHWNRFLSFWQYDQQVLQSLRWLGQVYRMGNSWWPRQLLYSQLKDEERNRGGLEREREGGRQRET